MTIKTYQLYPKPATRLIYTIEYQPLWNNDVVYWQTEDFEQFTRKYANLTFSRLRINKVTILIEEQPKDGNT